VTNPVTTIVLPVRIVPNDPFIAMAVGLQRQPKSEPVDRLVPLGAHLGEKFRGGEHDPDFGVLVD
jgi:hypothetical protein